MSRRIYKPLALTIALLVMSALFFACASNGESDDKLPANSPPADERVQLYKVTGMDTELKNTYIGSLSFDIPGMGATNYSVKLSLHKENYFRAEFIFSSLMGGTEVSSYMGKTEVSQPADGISDITFHFVMEDETTDSSGAATKADKYYTFTAKLDAETDRIFEYRPQITSGTRLTREAVELYAFTENTEKSAENITAVFTGAATRLTGENRQVLIGMLTTYSGGSFVFEYNFKSSAESVDGAYFGTYSTVADISGEYDKLTLNFEFKDIDGTLQDTQAFANLSGDGTRIWNIKPYYKVGTQFDKEMILNNILIPE